MRHIATAAVMIAACTSGCGLMESHRSCGVHFEVLMPPIIDTNTPVLIQGSGPQLSAHPMGTLAGPVTEGRSVHAPMAPMMTQPVPMPLPRTSISGDGCAPPINTRPLTCEEWLQLQTFIEKKGARKMPIGNPAE